MIFLTFQRLSKKSFLENSNGSKKVAISDFYRPISRKDFASFGNQFVGLYGQIIRFHTYDIILHVKPDILARYLYKILRRTSYQKVHGNVGVHSIRPLSTDNDGYIYISSKTIRFSSSRDVYHRLYVWVRIFLCWVICHM